MTNTVKLLHKFQSNLRWLMILGPKIFRIFSYSWMTFIIIDWHRTSKIRFIQFQWNLILIVYDDNSKTPFIRLHYDFACRKSSHFPFSSALEKLFNGLNFKLRDKDPSDTIDFLFIILSKKNEEWELRISIKCRTPLTGWKEELHGFHECHLSSLDINSSLFLLFNL